MWYVWTTDGKDHGPVSKDELDAWATTDHLSPDDLVYCEGWPTWQEAEKVYPQLFKANETTSTPRTIPKPLGVVVVAAFSGFTALQAFAFVMIVGTRLWLSMAA